jgi:hypothetical protein
MGEAIRLDYLSGPVHPPAPKGFPAMRLSALICLLMSLPALADEGGGSLYIVKVNGDTVYGSATVKERTFAPDMLFINGDSLQVSDVAVLKNDHGYFRHPLAGFGDEQLALRTFDGKVIDKYTVEQSGFAGPPGQMAMSTWHVGLYSKNEGDLKGIDYDNVKSDFWDNPGSRAMIEIYERKRRLQWWTLGGGILGVLVGAPLADEYPAVGGTLGTAGIVGIVMAIYHGNTKKQYLYKAVERYAE